MSTFMVVPGPIRKRSESSGVADENVSLVFYLSTYDVPSDPLQIASLKIMKSQGDIVTKSFISFNTSQSGFGYSGCKTD